jgi:hypothetical protein
MRSAAATAAAAELEAGETLAMALLRLEGVPRRERAPVEWRLGVLQLLPTPSHKTPLPSAWLLLLPSERLLQLAGVIP